MFSEWINATQTNHGLEHATIAVFIEKYGMQTIAGRASNDGFYVLGDVDTSLLLECAKEALHRMNNGKKELAISTYCGTNILITGALTTIFTSLSGYFYKHSNWLEKIMNALTWSVLAVVLSQPIGCWIQKVATTNGKVENIEITSIDEISPMLRKVHTQWKKY
ncbi:MAG: hypothetical protein CL792_00545 [Chloroflexi bacterium]|nr:hypothetical protein [Chloroflexota bacterium]|tara:strand:- start:1299 stop:1790 length:492 start_codon:yes stop_codon:yes gene_type:complete